MGHMWLQLRTISGVAASMHGAAAWRLGVAAWRLGVAAWRLGAAAWRLGVAAWRLGVAAWRLGVAAWRAAHLADGVPLGGRVLGREAAQGRLRREGGVPLRVRVRDAVDDAPRVVVAPG